MAGLKRPFRLTEIAEFRRIAEQAAGGLRELAQNPRTLSAWIEERSPWLGRRLLGVASNVAEPFTIGMGLNVETLSEEAIEVSLPGSWRNSGGGGVVHSGALAVLGEIAPRMFWEHHLDPMLSEISIVRVQVRILARVAGRLRGVYRIAVADREASLHRMRSDGTALVETSTSIYDDRGRLVAEVEAEWSFHEIKALK